MKNRIRAWVLYSIFTCSRIMYRLTWPFFSRKKSVIILAPSWEGSKGDEAVISACSAEMKSQGCKVTLIHFGEKREWAYLTTIDRWYGIPEYFSTGGWKDHFRFIFLFLKSGRFYLLGTDMLDGSYGEWLTLGLLKITHHAAFTGLKTNIVGISINTWQNPSCIRAMAQMPAGVRIGVRDAISWKRLSDLIPDREITATADIAFILKPRILSAPTQQYVDWVNDRKSKGSIVMGVNINPVSFAEHEQEAFFRLFIEAMSALIGKHPEKKFSFLFIPHDFRDKRNDCQFLKMLYDRLPENIAARTLLMEQQITSEEIKAAVSGVDFAISSRMHLTVALVSQAVPTACITYQPVKKEFSSYSEDVISRIHQDKFDGLFRHFDLSGLSLSPERALQPGELNAFIGMLYDNREAIHKKLQQYLPDVIAKSRLNLA